MRDETEPEAGLTFLGAVMRRAWTDRRSIFREPCRVHNRRIMTIVFEGEWDRGVRDCEVAALADRELAARSAQALEQPRQQ
jgi:hypothetical protein